MRILAPRARRARPLAAVLAAAAFVAPAPQSLAQDETRALGAHVHGVGALQIAFDGDEIALRFEAPAADLVGFERAPRTDEERSAVQAAVAALEDPLTLFAFAPAAGCTVRSAQAALTGLGDDDHDHADHGHDDHGRHDHDHGRHDHDHRHDHEHRYEHAHGDDAHAHGDDAHSHGDDDHDHGAEAFHAEFHADVLLTCTSPEAADAIEARYFERFPNARRLEATVIGPAGAQMLEATPEAPRLSLRGVL